MSTPKEAYLALQQQFSYSLGLQRDSLYREFHTLNFSINKGSLAEFNTRFSGLIARLACAKVAIHSLDQVNQYIKALERSFP